MSVTRETIEFVIALGLVLGLLASIASNVFIAARSGCPCTRVAGKVAPGGIILDKMYTSGP